MVEQYCQVIWQFKSSYWQYYAKFVEGLSRQAIDKFKKLEKLKKKKIKQIWATARLATVSQIEQVLVLPISFFGYGSIGIRGVGGSMDSL